jgi:hypothetical protein
MTKRAILIASRKEGEGDVRSFENDVTFIRDFLKSKNGGCWLDNEIIMLVDTTVEEILCVLEENNEYYRFIYYSGHGCTSNSKQYVLIDNVLVNITRLLNKIKRETAIFDCCRTRYSYKELKTEYVIQESMSISKSSKTRSCYDKFVKQNNGRLIAYVTGNGNYAKSFRSASFFIYAFSEVLISFQNANIKGVVSINKFLQRINMTCKQMKMEQRVKIRNNCTGKYPFYIE